MEYLGDGVYAGWDGYGIKLCVSDPRDPTDVIYIEPSVLRALNDFYKRSIQNE